MNYPSVWSTIEAAAFGHGFDYEDYCRFHSEDGHSPASMLDKKQYTDLCTILEDMMAADFSRMKKEYGNVEDDQALVE